eukprot:11471897-Alexandrium_andersonii.AAC.1
MSASLVGSEMCIRDRASAAAFRKHARFLRMHVRVAGVRVLVTAACSELSGLSQREHIFAAFSA